ncbi:MAG: hypothetical protein ACT4ON_10220 [Bacteroidota bacterium]
MKFKIIVCLVLMWTQIGVAQKQKQNETINWDANRPLVWSDFKGRPDNALPYHALTAGSLSCSFEKVSANESKLLIHMSFDTKKSWVKPKKATDELLIHEQCHFDIYEIYTRILVKKIEEENALIGPKYGEKTQKIFEKNFDELMKFQKKYDKETDHSKNEEKQKEWTEKIKNMLEENKQYEKREIVFKL